MKFSIICGLIFTLIVTVFAATSVGDSLSVKIDTVITDTNQLINVVQNTKINQAAIWILLAAAIKILMSLMKYKSVTTFLNTPKMKKIKPYIAITLGIIGGIITSNVTNQALSSSILMGAIAGFSATGLHETIKSIRGKNG